MVSIGLVALLHLGAGYALVTGLAYDAAKQAYEDLKTFDVQEEKPPEPEKPPPPPEKLDIPPPPKVTAPPPVNISPVISTNVQQVTITPTAPPAPPPPPPPPPPPAAPSVASKASPKGNPANWATTDDYPPSSLRAEEQGTTGFRVEIGTDGRVTSCSVTKSSGHSGLDDATCKLVTRRAKFTPAKDASGNPIADSYSNRVRWQIPQ